MSGFREDVITILKHNNMFHREAMGWVREQPGSGLAEDLQKLHFPVTTKFEKSVIRFDYIVLNRNYETVNYLMQALAIVSVGGLIIMELDDGSEYNSDYVSLFGGFSANRVKFGEDRYYLVIHNGVDYAD